MVGLRQWKSLANNTVRLQLFRAAHNEPPFFFAANPQMMQITQNQAKDPRTYAIIGAAMEVHRVLGCGFLEPVYQEALALKLAARGVPYRREAELPVFYKGEKLNSQYSADFTCFDAVVLELKALAKLSGAEESQIINHLKVTGLPFCSF